MADSLKLVPEAVQHARQFHRIRAAGQFQRFSFVQPPRRGAQVTEPLRNVLSGERDRTGQLPDRVEVPDQRPKRIEVGAWCACQQSVRYVLEQARPNVSQRSLRSASRCAHPGVQPPRVHRVARMNGPKPSKKVVVGGKAVRREDEEISREQGLHLFRSLPHRGRRGDVLGPHPYAAFLGRRKQIDGGLVHADHAAKGAFDQMQLVLQYKIGRGESGDRDVLPLCNERTHGCRKRGYRRLRRAAAAVVPQKFVAMINVAEERRRFGLKRQAGELVNGRDHHRRTAVVNLVVNRPRWNGTADRRPVGGEKRWMDRPRTDCGFLSPDYAGIELALRAWAEDLEINCLF